MQYAHNAWVEGKGKTEEADPKSDRVVKYRFKCKLEANNNTSFVVLKLAITDCAVQQNTDILYHLLT